MKSWQYPGVPVEVRHLPIPYDITAKMLVLSDWQWMASYLWSLPRDRSWSWSTSPSSIPHTTIQHYQGVNYTRRLMSAVRRSELAVWISSLRFGVKICQLRNVNRNEFVSLRFGVKICEHINVNVNELSPLDLVSRSVNTEMLTGNELSPLDLVSISVNSENVNRKRIVHP